MDQQGELSVKKSRRRRFALLTLVGLAGLWGGLNIWKPWLSDVERQLVGTWEVDDSPGDQLIQFDENGSGWFVYRKSRNGKEPFGWKIDDGHMVIRFATPGSLKTLWIALQLQVWSERHPIEFVGDTVEWTVGPEKKRVMTRAPQQQ